MKRFYLRLLTILAVAVPGAAQTPTITSGGVVNAASYTPAGLPGGGIAQGSLFIVFGKNMGPAALQQINAYPLPTALAGTSINVTAGGASVKPLMVYTSAGQLAAIMPSATPIGSATLTVAYNGQTSNPAPVQVVASSFGAFSVNQGGNGPGIVSDASYQVAGATQAAQPGETYILWGTGLGAVTGDEAAGPVPGDLTNVPVEVYVGGQMAKVAYRGRSGCCAGLDQIVFQVPAGVTGCRVSLAVKIGNVVGNFVTMPIAAGGRTCSDPAGLSTGDLQTLSQQGTVAFGFISLSRTSSVLTLPPPLGNGQPMTNTTESGFALFEKFDFSQVNAGGASQLFGISNFGACSVFTFTGNAGSLVTVTGDFKSVGLDAGAALTVTGPNGAKQIAKEANLPGFYGVNFNAGPLGVPTTAPPYLTKGSYQFTGPGGVDVGAFTATLNLSDPLVWTNEDGINTVARAQGLNVTWTGGDPNAYVSIGGFAFSGTTNPVGAEFSCVEKVSAGQFTVPPVILLALPASTTVGPAGFSVNSLSVGTSTLPVKFSAPGLDVGYATSSASASKSVTYQ
ncbi:MAG: hypothetical protein M3Y07_12280 [Acidobacteriota bacterium]|nr:hypothetical protein [Acidobacteriota bacterium]